MSKFSKIPWNSNVKVISLDLLHMRVDGRDGSNC